MYTRVCPFSICLLCPTTSPFGFYDTIAVFMSSENYCRWNLCTNDATVKPKMVTARAHFRCANLVWIVPAFPLMYPFSMDCIRREVPICNGNCTFVNCPFDWTVRHTALLMAPVCVRSNSLVWLHFYNKSSLIQTSQGDYKKFGNP